MRKIFIDGGAHDGCSVRKFRAERRDAEEFEIYCFEPNPQLCEILAGLDRVEVIPAALWGRDGRVAFYPARDEAFQGSSLLAGKRTGRLDRQRPLTVAAVRLGRWLRRRFRPSDRIVVKLDVEGAEYSVLDELVASDAVGYLSELYVEFHWRRVGVGRDRHRRALGSIVEGGLRPHHWSALSYCRYRRPGWRRRDGSAAPSGGGAR